jgi:hypothetical protein
MHITRCDHFLIFLNPKQNTQTDLHRSLFDPRPLTCGPGVHVIRPRWPGQTLSLTRPRPQPHSARRQRHSSVARGGWRARGNEEAAHPGNLGWSAGSGVAEWRRIGGGELWSSAGRTATTAAFQSTMTRFLEREWRGKHGGAPGLLAGA